LKNWRDKALCAVDKNSYFWFSYDYQEVEYAKDICKKCTVRQQCLTSAWKESFIYGVNGGLSEFDILLETWKKAKREDDSNWSRTDKLLQKLLRKIK
jgi:hypothetical protein